MLGHSLGFMSIGYGLPPQLFFFAPGSNLVRPELQPVTYYGGT